MKADPKYTTLLQILSKQLELLVIEGQPDIQSLLKSLVDEGLVSERERREIASKFGSEPVGHRVGNRVNSAEADVGVEPDLEPGIGQRRRAAQG